MAEMYNDEAWNKTAGLHQRIAALEAELAAAQAAHAKSHEEAADWRRLHTELLTELSPWRQMVAQLEALRGAGVTPQITLTSTEGFLCVLSKLFHEVEYAYGPTLPAAVAAAYEQVMGMSGTKIVKLIKLTERGKWHINERGFPVCGASLELDPIDEMEIERRILHEHAGVCVVCKREFKGVGDE